MLRRGLDFLYAASAGLAALSLLGIFLMMMAQVALREMGRQLPGADDLTAYLCVATTFFALAHTFRRGELIRVGMAIEKLNPRMRLFQEGVALALAAVVVGTITWYTLQDVIFSYEIEDLAQGTVPFLLWIPKLAMPIGSAILLIAIIDEAFAVARGAMPNYVVEAADRAARGDFSAEV
ncbi:TRAP transporter small permease [Humitalea sp. 24SJ18S-53]|uniref:TRAP transporter small permease n=1 Tax=Humitalea sp. 24SJ18S-53 TaxID=3422307 RepID=UPI003D670804